MPNDKQPNRAARHSKLEKYEDNWQTSMGGWFAGEDVILRGKSVFTELNGKGWMEYLIFACTGKEVPDVARLMEAIWVISSSFPDPRIWNNRISALAGTVRSTNVLGAAGSLAVTEATLYGMRPIIGAADFLHRAQQNLDVGEELSSIIRRELKEYRSVYGFGRPLINRDERIKPMLEYAQSMGFADGSYVKLVFDIEEYFATTRFKYQMNIAALTAALMTDLGFTPTEFYHVTTLAFSAGAMACYIDAVEKDEGSFFPLRTSRVEFKGREELRKWRN